MRKVIAQLRKRANVVTLSDSTGAALTGRETLLRALVLRRLLRRTAPADERAVGILLPPTVAAAVTNLALALDRRVAVNLNYSLSEELVQYSIAEAGVRRVITSRAFLERMPLDLGGVETVILEDLAPRAARSGQGGGRAAIGPPHPHHGAGARYPRHPRGRADDDHLHLGVDRETQRSDAPLAQHRGQHGYGGRPAPAAARRRHARRAPLLPHLRLHDHPLDHAGDGLRRGLPHQPAGSAASSAG